ncbi:hypothetical protein [Halolactibacillus sp. JCM 19043]|uniref:hypothetical protein n=1 Tax=Halolactibacillus sp. JCM 19043 TaxID=1460638 RepID=UPI0012E324FA|nr:hypothetical protein [Halolactibacillus sp. JCM 19043]
MAIGNMIRVSDTERVVNYYLTVQNILNGSRRAKIPNIKEYFSQSKFRSQSNQALMVKTDVIRGNNLKMPVGAIGQDTTFFQELLIHSEWISAINENIHIYYAGVTSSTVNNITLKTFKKYMLMEEYRIEYLKKHNLLDEYIAVKLNQYVEDWYFKKLELLKGDDIQEAKKILYAILMLYIPHVKLNEFSPNIRQFINEHN